MALRGSTESEEKPQDTHTHVVPVLSQAISKPFTDLQFLIDDNICEKALLRGVPGTVGISTHFYRGENRSSKKLPNLSKDVPTDGKVRTEEARMTPDLSASRF